MSRVKRVDELTESPVIGRTYLVPCVFDVVSEHWIPVRGPLHDDREIIGFAAKHWHRDTRFAVKQREIDSDGGNRAQIQMLRVVAEDKTTGEVRYLLRRCLSRDVDFPMKTTSSAGNVHRNPFAADLETAFEGMRLKCMKCPHRGFDLSNMKPDHKGRVVCPGHGLQWNTRTGRLNRRTPRKETVRA